MFIYDYNVNNTLNVGTKIASLTVRIAANFTILQTLLTINFNVLTSTYSFDFATALSSEELNVLDILVQIIIEEQAINNFYTQPYIVQTIKNPTTDNDEQNGYLVGCISVNTATGKSYVCFDNLLGSAVWTENIGSTGPTGATGAMTDYFFGDGISGSVLLTGTNTLTNDLYYTKLELGTGTILNMNGFRLFVNEILVIYDNVTVSATGGNAVTSAAGIGNAGNTVGNASNGGVGGNGATTNGTNGTNTTNHVFLTVNAFRGGAGGAGNSGGAATTAGTAGTITNNTAANGGQNILRIFPYGTLARNLGFAKVSNGTGGGGGGRGNLTTTGGGGGGGGGLILIAAKTISTVGLNHLITVAGGNGANGVGTGGGGGGGGGGGLILIFTQTPQASLVSTTFNVSAGLGGTGVAPGANGVNGSPGFAYYYQLV